MPTNVDAIVFDTGISYGARGGATFMTTIITTDTGFEQRNANWDIAQLRWNVGHLIQTRAQLAYMIQFFRSRRGRARGFLFKDWSDYYVGMAWVNNVLTPDPDLAEPVATSDGVTTEYQLTKTYDDGATTPEVRYITRPKVDACMIYLDDVEWTPNEGNYIDSATGMVYFDPAPAEDVVITWAGEFYVPVRFDTDQMALQLEGPAAEWADIPIVEIREPEE
jgi:uncharacterized protein (TIGR02217 family)